jgi:hypothetical protein
MKNIILTLFAAALLSSCTNDKDFTKGKAQLENMNYTDVKNTGYAPFCCSDEDDFASGFTAKDKNGNTVEGCICSGVFKGATVRFD